jgi:hypothetical protein
MVHAGRSTADIGVVSVEMVRPGQPAYHPAVHVQREGPGELCRAVPYDGEPWALLSICCVLRGSRRIRQAAALSQEINGYP